MFVLRNALIHTENGPLTHHSLLIEQGHRGSAAGRRAACWAPSQDLRGQHLSAGFIDLQINGCGGVMFNAAPCAETVALMHASNLRSGTTSFLPTLITSPDRAMEQAIEACRSYMQHHAHTVLGLHLEGPYINPLRKGIHPAEQIRTPSEAMIRYLCQQAPWIATITLAPEQNDPQHIRRLTEAGIQGCPGTQCRRLRAGHRRVRRRNRFATHLYNAMTPTLNGREPGTAGAVYDRPEIYAGIIIDGQHVHPANVRLAHQIWGATLPIDATAAAGAPDGFSQSDFEKVHLCSLSAVTLQLYPECNLAVPPMMIEGVKNLVEFWSVCR